MRIDEGSFLGYPRIQTLLDRAYTYRHETYARLGSPPETFLVTEEEYDLLQRYGRHERRRFERLQAQSYGPPVIDRSSDSSPQPTSIFGMRVVCQERFSWYRNARTMEHFQRSSRSLVPLSMWDPLLYPAEEFSRCQTVLPSSRVSTMVCPCGEVLWDMSTCTAWWQLLTPEPLVPVLGRDIDMPYMPASVFQAIHARVEEQIAAAFGVPVDLLRRRELGNAEGNLTVVATERADESIDLYQISWDLGGPDYQSQITVDLGRDGESMETPESPLPDETLTCCAQDWPTHAAWMVHFRMVHR